jgi:hypothetical protein
VHGDKARAKTFDAGEILVAIGLVDLALAAELRLQRLNRNAVRRRRAVAAQTRSLMNARFGGSG